MPCKQKPGLLSVTEHADKKTFAEIRINASTPNILINAAYLKRFIKGTYLNSSSLTGKTENEAAKTKKLILNFARILLSG